MGFSDRLGRLRSLFTWPATERRTVFVRSDDPCYELYYDGRAKPVLEYRGRDGQIVQVELTRDQEKEFARQGPAYIAELYHAIVADRPHATSPIFEPEVERRLQDDYPEVVRWIAASHLARYGPERPHHVRVQMALLEIANRNVHALEKWVSRAEIDYRWPLREAGGTDSVGPLPEGASGIDLSLGAIVGTQGAIGPSLTKTEFMASRLFTGETHALRKPGIEILACEPLTLFGVAFHPALRFDGQRLIEVWLGRPEDDDARGWLDLHLPQWQGVFWWGSVDVEGGAIVVSFFPAAGR